MVRSSLVVDESLGNDSTKRSLHYDARREFEGRMDIPLDGLRFNCSSCLGRVKTSIKRLPREAQMSLDHKWRSKKSKHYLKKLSCVSSSDALSPITSVVTTSYDRSRKTKHRSELPDGLRNNKGNATDNADSALHGNIKRGLRGLLGERPASASADQLHGISRRRNSESSLWAGNWCIVEPTAIRSGAVAPVTTASLVNNAIRPYHFNPGRRHQAVNEEIVTERSHDFDRGSTAGSMVDPQTYSNVRRSLIPDCANFITRMFPESSGSRAAGGFNMIHRARWSLSSSSYLSSPDVLSDYDVHTPQSPNLSRSASPDYSDGLRVQSGSEFPLFRPYRQFPNQLHDEIEEYGGLPERIFMWEPNVFLEGNDQFRDLRLDIDNMSYEELLALEESMGIVCTGLDRSAIPKCLRSGVFRIDNTLSPADQDNDTKCSICQVDFEEENDLGILDCGHKHHFLCIQEWLLQKNQCPICKASAMKS